MRVLLVSAAVAAAVVSLPALSASSPGGVAAPVSGADGYFTACNVPRPGPPGGGPVPTHAGYVTPAGIDMDPNANTCAPTMQASPSGQVIPTGATGTASLAAGTNAAAAGDSSTAVGTSAAAPGVSAVAVGAAALAASDFATAIGSGASATGVASTAVGVLAVAHATNATAVGDGAQAVGSNSVALGVDSVANRPNSVSVGTGGNLRQITHVVDGTQATDAVNLRQVQAGDAATLQIANTYADGVGAQAVSTAKTYTDAVGARAVNAANAYTQEVGNWAKAYTDMRVGNLTRRVSYAIAAGAADAQAAAALAGADPSMPNRVALGVGSAAGEQAWALTYQHLFPGRHWAVNAGIGGGGNAAHSLAVGTSLAW